MTVAQLIEELKGLPQYLEVYVSSDAEGNDYNYLSGVYNCTSVKRDYGIDILADEDVDNYIADGEKVEDVCVIYPC